MIFTYTSDLEKWLKVTVHPAALNEDSVENICILIAFFFTEVKPTWLLRQSR